MHGSGTDNRQVNKTTTTRAGKVVPLGVEEVGILPHYLVSTGLNYGLYERLESLSTRKKVDRTPFPGTVIFLVAFEANPMPARAIAAQAILYP